MSHLGRLLLENITGAVVNKMAPKQNQLATFDDVAEEEDCPLLDLLNAEAFELILDKLSVRDVVALMLTSKTARGTVDQYVGRRGKQRRWLRTLDSFLGRSPMTKPEVEEETYIKHKLIQARKSVEERCRSCRLQNVASYLQDTSFKKRREVEIRRAEQLTCKCGDSLSEDTLSMESKSRIIPQVSLTRYKSIRNILDNCDRIRRHHVYNADHFAHMGDRNYVCRTFNRELQRDVVHLKSVCWLHFRLAFTGVRSGRYRVSLRVRALSGLRWGSSSGAHGTTITVSSSSSQGSADTLFVPKSVWKAMARRRRRCGTLSLVPFYR